jgi:hypothetical protein
VENKLHKTYTNAFGYKPLYETKKYHIVNESPRTKKHQMTIECNEQSIKPLNNKFPQTMGFNQYSKRLPINYEQIRAETPNHNRFNHTNFYPKYRSGAVHNANFKMKKMLGRDSVLFQ